MSDSAAVAIHYAPLRERTIAWLRQNVSEHRVNHILGVESMSVELACTHGLDVEKAALAGLMHDLAKYFMRY